MYKKALILILIVFTVVSCKKEQYQFKWKIPSGDVVIYKIQMETIDSLSSVTEKNMSLLVDMIAQMYGDSVTVPVDTKDLYKGLVKQLNMLAYFSILRQGAPNEMKIDFITRQIKEYEQIKYLEIFNKFIRKAFFKGTLTPDGKLISEGGEQVYDPKINILFELPEKPVSIGDTWALNLKPPTNSAKKFQKDSLKNKVTFKDLILEEGDSIAVLEYQLQSPDKSGNVIRFTGNGRFSLVQGKWLDYTGMFSQKTSSLLEMNHVQKIKLNEISIETYKSLIKQAQKSDIFGNMKEEVDNNVLNSTTNTNENLNPCPEVFRIQLLAAQSPVKDRKAEFKNITYQIDEIIGNPDEKFKYKYTVGKECSMDKAKTLLEQIHKSGYPKAYIIKTK